MRLEKSRKFPVFADNGGDTYKPWEPLRRPARFHGKSQISCNQDCGSRNSARVHLLQRPGSWRNISRLDFPMPLSVKFALLRVEGKPSGTLRAESSGSLRCCYRTCQWTASGTFAWNYFLNLVGYLRVNFKRFLCEETSSKMLS